MRRFRLSTLLLLIVIASLSIALAVQQRRGSRREAELQGRLALSWPVYQKQQQRNAQMKLDMDYTKKLVRRINATHQQQPR